MPWYDDGTVAKKKNEKKVLGWHFLPKDMKLAYDDNRTAKVGETLSVQGSDSPGVCSYGMHASHRAGHAAKFKKGPMLCRVQVWGEVDDDGDKFAGKHRHVLWAKELTAKDLTKLLKDCGYSASSTSQDDLLATLGNVGGSYRDAVSDWLEKWAAKHGANGKTVEITFVKKEVTKDVVKRFLSHTLIRTAQEIADDIREAYDVDGSGNTAGSLEALKDVLDDLCGWRDDGRCVEDWKETSNGRWVNGYVLRQKRKR